MDACEVVDNPKDNCKELSQGDDKASTQVHPEIAGSQLGSAVGFHDVTVDGATVGAIQIVHHVGRHPDSEPPISLVDETCLDGNPSTAENQAGSATTTAHFECGSHSLIPTTHLAVRIINGSPPAADKSGAPEAAPLNAGSSLGTLAILTISLVSGPARAAPASPHVSGKPVASAIPTAHHDDTLQRQHSELSHNKLILRKQQSEISSNNQIFKKQWLELSSHSNGNSPDKDKSKDKCNKC